jgi:RNA polymerase sigma-70 factor (ECF subfamily)
MQAQQAYAAHEGHTVAHICEQHRAQLQDALSRCLPALYRRAYRYVEDPHDAEDAVQDALLSAYKHLDQFKATAKMTTWLTTIVTNSALTQLRKRSRHPYLSLNDESNEGRDHFLSDTLADARPNPEDVCSSSESQGLLMKFIAQLSPSLRRAIQLRYIDGLSMREAAQLLDVPTATMKARLWRARAQLKRMMSEL